MKSVWFSYITSLILVGILAATLFWIIVPILERQFSLVSPLPTYLSRLTNNQVLSLDIWSPSHESVQGASLTLPTLTARAVLMYDMENNKVLYEQHATERMPMASLTKIMTAVVAMENRKPDDRYIVYKSDLVGEDTMGLTENEVLSLEELLYGLMLPSGNDAAEVLAHNYTYGRNAFIQAMNDKAKSLGLQDTQFSNPSGLQGDGAQYTTAYDLLVMTKYALENYPLFADIVSKSEHTFPATTTHKYFYLENATNLLTTYPGVKGVKTGFTPEAGLCLVTYLEYKDKKVIGVLLGSQNRRAEMRELLDYSLKKLGTPPPTAKI